MIMIKMLTLATMTNLATATDKVILEYRFLKHTGTKLREPYLRDVKLLLDRVTWGSGTGSRFIKLDDIKFVKSGKGTKVWQSRKDTNETLCFSVVSGTATLDLQAKNEHERNAWVEALREAATLPDSLQKINERLAHDELKRYIRDKKRRDSRRDSRRQAKLMKRLDRESETVTAGLTGFPIADVPADTGYAAPSAPPINQAPEGEQGLPFDMTSAPGDHEKGDEVTPGLTGYPIADVPVGGNPIPSAPQDNLAPEGQQGSTCLDDGLRNELPSGPGFQGNFDDNMIPGEIETCQGLTLNPAAEGQPPVHSTLLEPSAPPTENSDMIPGAASAKRSKKKKTKRKYYERYEILAMKPLSIIIDYPGTRIKTVGDGTGKLAGLKCGDLIAEVNGKQLESHEQLLEEIGKMEDGVVFKLSYKREVRAFRGLKKGAARRRSTVITTTRIVITKNIHKALIDLKENSKYNITPEIYKAIFEPTEIDRMDRQLISGFSLKKGSQETQDWKEWVRKQVVARIEEIEGRR